MESAHRARHEQRPPGPHLPLTQLVHRTGRAPTDNDQQDEEIPAATNAPGGRSQARLADGW